MVALSDTSPILVLIWLVALSILVALLFWKGRNESKGSD